MSVSHHSNRETNKVVLFCLLIPFIVVYLEGCEKSGEVKPAQDPQKEAAPVKVCTVMSRDIPFELATIGSVESCAVINIKAQISGEITKVWFNEGDEVKKDQILFSIDSRPYLIDLQQATSDLEKAKAQLEVSKANLVRNQVQGENALNELNRNSRLLTQGVVTTEEFDRIKTNSKSFEAAVLADTAGIRSASAAIQGASIAITKAQLELGYCTIRSPIDGKAGSHLINQGNLVKANDTPALVVIHQIDPIYVSFTLPEGSLPQVQKAMQEGTVAVRAFIRAHGDLPVQGATGTLTFLDNTVNQKTGTIRLKATFANSARLLWPGQFVTVGLVVSVHKNATVVPSPVVQTGQTGTYVYVLKPDSTVELRPVEIGDSRDDLVIIKKGLQPGETVVTDGHILLAPGKQAKVM